MKLAIITLHGTTRKACGSILLPYNTRNERLLTQGEITVTLLKYWSHSSPLTTYFLFQIIQFYIDRELRTH